MSYFHYYLVIILIFFGFTEAAVTAFGQDIGFSREQPPDRPEQIWDNPLMRPAFAADTETLVLTSVGRVAYLHCRVNHLGNRVVTWIRKRDGHVLTSALYSYTTDQRFTAIHSEKSPNDWILKITTPQVRDSGVYECQVSTEPKISRHYNLTVIESTAVIDGPRDRHMSAGNALSLVCHISVHQNAPSYFYWYHNNEVIQYTTIQKSANDEKEDEKSISKLVIENVGSQNSGNYTCAPENSVPATVTIYVLRGEHPAAMQHGESSTAVQRCSFLVLLSATLSLSLFLRL